MYIKIKDLVIFTIKNVNVIGEEITITVTMPDGERLSLSVTSLDTLIELRKKIEEQIGESLDNKILMSGSTELMGSKNLKELNIEDGANITIKTSKIKGTFLCLFYSDQRSIIVKSLNIFEIIT